MLWTITWTGELPQRKTRGYKTDLNVGIIFSFYSDFGFYTVRPVRQERSDDTEPEIGIERKNKTYLFSEPANQVYRANVIAVATPILPDGPFSAVRSIRRFR